MRILFCNYEYPPLGGGGGVINKQIAEELAKQHEVVVLTSQGLGKPRFIVENGVMVHRVPVFFRSRQAAANMPSMLAYLPSGYKTGRRLMRDNNFDIINTHFAVPTGPLGNWLSEKFSIPNVLSVHGGDLYDPSKWISPHRHAILRRLVRSLLRKADAVVGQSSNTLKNVYDYYDKNLECECIPLGIPRPDSNHVALREDYGIPGDATVLVTVGRLVSRKAVDQLISVLSSIEDPDVHLVVIGSGPQEESLKKIAAELDLTARVHFTGQLEEDEKFGLLRMADIYASTSQHEGFGIVYLEAMASGLPIVCYDYGGQTDFLETGINGFVVSLNDIDKFRQGCEQLIRDKELRKQVAEQNLKDVSEYYIDRCADRYLQLFERVIENGKK
ncbi:MAG: glycosyltransferase family 4 protein [Gammaproteobacteria bacterium]|nr:glycosyltransferase family 4 protein [Gammaproteobacteria bacterium]